MRIFYFGTLVLTIFLRFVTAKCPQLPWSLIVHVTGMEQSSYMIGPGQAHMCRNLWEYRNPLRELQTLDDCLRIYTKFEDCKGPSIPMPKMTRWNWAPTRKDRPVSIGCC
ncbi:uncharacterized protein [Bemisia tabaci]|uniref:uncharacterized protein n=1 Tax=Bemisia tabaci TaxID=7038 RepID=UPI003B28BDF6